MKNKSKGFIQLIPIIIILLVIGSGSYYAVTKLRKSEPSENQIEIQQKQATTKGEPDNTLPELPISQNNDPSDAPEVLRPIDCGTDINCFNGAVKTCAAAKVTVTDRPAESGLTYIETVKGYEGADCLISTTYTEVWPYPTPVVGKEMTCKVPPTELMNFREYLQGEQAVRKNCEGSLVDLLIEMAK